MIQNSNKLQEVLLALNPYKAESNELSRRRSILYIEMCHTVKLYSSLKQFQIEITKEKMAESNDCFKSLCPVVFDYDLVCAAKNLLTLLTKTQSIKKQYDPKYNKAVYVRESSTKEDYSARAKEFLDTKRKRAAA